MRKLIESLTRFDERFPYAAMEDVDLRLRLTKKGYTFPFIKSASVCHPWKSKTGTMDGWKQLNRQHDSTLIYLSIHPEELQKNNSSYYIRCVLRSFFKEVIPGLFYYRSAGAKEDLVEHIFSLRMAFIVWWKFRLLKLNW